MFKFFSLVPLDVWVVVTICNVFLAGITLEKVGFPGGTFRVLYFGIEDG